MAEQREWLRITLESIGDAVIATDINGRVVFLNAVAEHLTGWRAAEAKGRDCREIFNIVNDATRAEVESVRGFVVTGWHRSGWPEWDPEGAEDEPEDPYSRKPLNDHACPADSCLYGYFTTDPAGGGAAGPSSIRITG